MNNFDFIQSGGFIIHCSQVLLKFYNFEFLLLLFFIIILYFFRRVDSLMVAYELNTDKNDVCCLGWDIEKLCQQKRNLFIVLRHLLFLLGSSILIYAEFGYDCLKMKDQNE